VKNLSDAIKSKFTGSSFSTSIGGRFYKGRAPQKPTWPYAVYFIISDVPRNTFTDRIEDVIIQFSIFSSASGSTEIEDIFTNLKSLFDFCTLAITGNTHLEMERQGASLTSGELDIAEGTGEYWQYDVDYNVLMKKN
jgi:hypothetical protein